MPKRKKSRSDSQGTIVDAFENRWRECVPLSREQLAEVEKELQMSLPAELRKLFLTCNGGVPEKTYFGTDRIEVEIGSLLPIRSTASGEETSFESVYRRLVSKAEMPSSLIPFGYDTGRAGVFCVDAESSRVVYYVHDEPEDPKKEVAASLDDFLSNLTLPPY